VTARWVVDEVKDARDLEITWHPISLLFKNEPPEDSDYHAPVLRTHQLLRVMEAVREPEGEDAVFRLYWEYGRRIHNDKQLVFDVADALEAVGLPTTYAAAFDDDSWDTEIRRRMDSGIELAGDDIGTPILAFEDKHGDKQGYFGPVITRVPPTEDSLAMWDALCTMMDVQGFWELKRTRTERPEFGERP